MTDTEYLDGFIGELLHINEVGDNKLIDLNASGGAYKLAHTCIDLSAYALTTIAERIGKTGNTILLNSAISGGEQRLNRKHNTFEWQAIKGAEDVKALHAFIANARKDLIARGNNPLFMGVGALKWRVAVKEGGKETLREVISPLLVFPVKLVVTGNSAPVVIEFIDDEIYINPCLTAKLAQVFGEELAKSFPSVGGVDVNAPVDLKALGDGTEYFKAVAAYVGECNHSDGADGTLFEFDKDFISIAQYKHDELCTYYDIRRNREKIYSHPLVERLFSRSAPADKKAAEAVLPEYVLPRDSVQENIITRVVNGESLIVKGPPGTGKTVTIANMLATLISQNKKVLFASKKISALTEVYAKLPERLRKFTMLLDSETEKSAAKINPEEIKQDFKRLIFDCKEYREPARLSTDLRQANAERAKAMKALSAYIELTYKHDRIAGDSFYAALNAVCKNDLPVIEFADGEDIKKVTGEQYGYMLAQVGEAEKSFAVMGKGGAHPVYKCPWFGVDLSCDSEAAVAFGEKLAKGAAQVTGAVGGGLKNAGLNAEEFTLGQILNSAICTLADDSICAIVNEKGFNADAAARKLETAICNYTAVPKSKFGWKAMPDVKTLASRSVRLADCKTDGELTFEQIESIVENEGVLKIGESYLDEKSLATLVKLFDDKTAKEREAESKVSSAGEVFKSDLGEEETALIREGAEVLCGYSESGAEKPKAFDFKAKKIYKRLCGLSYLSAPSFKDISGAIGKYARAFALKAEIETVYESVYKIFRKKLTPEEISCVKLVVEKCTGGHTGVCAYVNQIKEGYGFIRECHDAIEDDNKAASVRDIILCYEKDMRRAALKEALEAFNGLAPVYGEKDGGKEEEIARNILSAIIFVGACIKQGADTAAAIKGLNAVRSAGGINDEVQALISGFEEFGNKFFRNYYAVNGGDCTLGDMNIYAEEIADRAVIAAAASYTAVKNHPQNALDLNEFLYPFEKGETIPAGYTFAEAFEHSFYRLAVKAEYAMLGIMRNGLGAYAKNNLENLKNADEKLSGLNAELIESRCLSRVKHDDADFVFVQDRNPNENLRLAFKRNARGILKLKRCLILSPYTASLLFGTEEYDHFDVLIVDEASQLEPATVLPVLFRSKQCVLVGDEWQMPPIKHFVALAPNNDDGSGEGYGALESEISVLGLALRNGGFPVEELICHYRSKTETLIKFSQELFYPNMRTFPSPVPSRVPEKGVAGLGLKDVYVPEGFVAAGKNEAEADKVVQELKQHFDNYYDEKTKKLSLSVGVVAFGEAQCSLIESKVKADKALNKKITDAIEKFDDLPEKLIFFKTIETVQGQETGHLILSITHGKRESGLHMHFGQLNQGKLGRCIFNVAVTRAQNMVTVVHSVRAAEITNESVSYIRDYLATVERFSQGECGQFISEQAGKGFIESVAQFVKSRGIAKERVVVNYGVTEGSVRIPVVVLGKDLKSAVLGIRCEIPLGGKYDYIDYNMRYRSSLVNCGWKIHDIFIHDWVDNSINERKALERVLTEIINEENK